MPESTQSILQLIGDFATPIVVLLGALAYAYAKWREGQSEQEEKENTFLKSMALITAEQRTANQESLNAAQVKFEANLALIQLENEKDKSEMEAKIAAFDKRTMDMMKMAEDQQHKITNLEQQIILLTAVRDELQKQLDEEIGKRRELAAELDKVKAQMAANELAYTKQIKDANTEISNLNRRLGEVTEALTQAIKDRDEAIEAAAIAHDTAAAMRETLQGQTKKIEQLQSDLAVEKGRLTRYINKTEPLESKNEAA